MPLLIIVSHLNLCTNILAVKHILNIYNFIQWSNSVFLNEYFPLHRYFSSSKFYHHFVSNKPCFCRYMWHLLYYFPYILPYYLFLYIPIYSNSFVVSFFFSLFLLYSDSIFIHHASILKKLNVSVNSINVFFFPYFRTNVSFLVLCCDIIINNSKQRPIILTVIGSGANVLPVTRAVFGYFWFEYFWGVLWNRYRRWSCIFRTLGRGIEAIMTKMRSL